MSGFTAVPRKANVFSSSFVESLSVSDVSHTLSTVCRIELLVAKWLNSTTCYASPIAPFPTSPSRSCAASLSSAGASELSVSSAS